MFFVQDIESLGVESTSVMLSNTFLLVEPEKLPHDNTEAFYALCENSITVKFDVAEQIELGRTRDKSTIEWWKNQSDFAKRVSLLPNKNLDRKGVEGLEELYEWMSKVKNYKNIPVWVRGSLDFPVFDSFRKTFQYQEFVRYNCYRDVRTMIELVYPDKSKAGYVPVPNFDADKHVIKHVPEHDCAYDALMMLRGIQ